MKKAVEFSFNKRKIQKKLKKISEEKYGHSKTLQLDNPESSSFSYKPRKKDSDLKPEEPLYYRKSKLPYKKTD